MGIKQRGLDDLTNRFSPERFTRVMEEVMDETTQEGVESMVDTINTNGTDRQWSHEWFGRTGTGRERVNTGAMRDGVQQGDMTSKTGQVRSSFGWVHGTPMYAVFQEYGFLNHLTNTVVEGMNSIEEGAEDAADFAVDALQRAANDFLKGK